MPRCALPCHTITARLAAVGDGPPGRFRVRKLLKLSGRWLLLRNTWHEADGEATVVVFRALPCDVPMRQRRDDLANMAGRCGLSCRFLDAAGAGEPRRVQVGP